MLISISAIVFVRSTRCFTSYGNDYFVELAVPLLFLPLYAQKIFPFDSFCQKVISAEKRCLFQQSVVKL